MSIRPSRYEWIASRLLGSPLEGPANVVRGLKRARRRWLHPELADMLAEDRRIRELLDRHVTDGINCVDVGAHLGSMTAEFFARSPSGHHASIEALPYKVDWLRGKFPKADIHACAVGATEGEVEFFFHPDESGYSAMRNRGERGEAQRLVVPCHRLDELIPTDRPIGFLKIDVEGAELEVLRGASRILATDRPVVLFECVPFGLRTFGVTTEDLAAHFDAAGYDVYHIQDRLDDRDPMTSERLEAAITYPPEGRNFVAAPR